MFVPSYAPEDIPAIFGDGPRPTIVVAVRLSSPDKWDDFVDLHDRTIRHCPDDIRSKLEAYGVDPLRHPDRHLDCYQIRMQGTAARGALVWPDHGRVVELLYMGTGRKNDLNDEVNAWKVTIVSLLRATEPELLVVDEADRMGRSLVVQAEIIDTAATCQTLIQDSRGRYDPTRDNDRRLLGVSAVMAEGAVEHFDRGSTKGQVQKALDGKWPFSGQALGFPFERARGGVIVLPPANAKVIPAYLEVLSAPSLTYMERAKKLGELGISGFYTRTGPARNRAELTSTGARNAVRRHLETALSLEHGSVTVRIHNRTRARELLGLKAEMIEPISKAPNGYFVVEIPLPRPDPPLTDDPDYPFGPKHVFDAIRVELANIEARKGTRGRDPGRLGNTPLAGSTWTDGDWDYVLHSSGPINGFHVFRRPAGTEGGWSSPIAAGYAKNRLEKLARHRVDEFMRGLVVGIAQAVRVGHPARIEEDLVAHTEGPLRFVTSDEGSERRRIEAELAKTRQAIDRALEIELESDDPETRAVVRQKRSVKEQERVHLEQALRAIERGARTVPLELSSEELVSALARLWEFGADIRPEIRREVEEIVVNLRGEIGPWQCQYIVDVRLPGVDGAVVTLEGVTFRVPNRMKELGLVNRYRKSTERYMIEGASIEHLLDEGALSYAQLCRFRIATNLQEPPWSLPPWAAKLLPNVPIPLVRQAIASFRGLDVVLPEDVDPKWVRAIGERFTASSPRRRGYRWAVAPGHRQAVADFLRDQGGSAPHREVLRRFAGFVTPQELNSFVRARDRGWWDTFEIAEDPDKVWSLKRCPHCGGWASVVLRVAWMETSLLCPDCMREPVAGSPVYPAVHLAIPDLLDERRSKPKARRSSRKVA